MDIGSAVEIATKDITLVDDESTIGMYDRAKQKHGARPSKRGERKITNAGNNKPYKPEPPPKSLDFTFIHVPKTGGTSIARAISNSGFEFKDSHKTAEVHSTQGILRNPAYALIRDPFDRLVSGYHYCLKRSGDACMVGCDKMLKYKDFEDFVMKLPSDIDSFGTVLHKMIRPQAHFVCDDDGAPLVELFSFDRINEFHEMLVKKHGITGELPHLRKVDEPDTPYTDEMRKIVMDIFADDFTLYNGLTNEPTKM
jgi:hypothetical protein